jgi:predicted transcriptional regulator
MPKPSLFELTRRERQIMDILYRLGRAAAGQVLAELPGQPSYSTVRTQLRVLERKGYVRHEAVGPRYIYFPVAPREKVRQSALRHVVETFFEGSVEKAVAALLSAEFSRLSPQQLDRLAQWIDRARKAREGQGE